MFSKSVVEQATVLAALRYWAREGLMSAGGEQDIATNSGMHRALTSDEVNDLADRFAEGLLDPIVVIQADGASIHAVSANVPARVIWLDRAHQEADPDTVATIGGETVSLVNVFVTSTSEPVAPGEGSIEPEMVESVAAEVDQWLASQDVHARTDIRYQEVGRNDLGIDGADIYALVSSTEMDLTSAQVQTWLQAKFGTGEMTPSRAALTSMEVVPHPGCKHLAIMSFRRDV